jgi:hypothetical protein
MGRMLLVYPVQLLQARLTQHVLSSITCAHTGKRTVQLSLQMLAQSSSIWLQLLVFAQGGRLVC